MDSDTKARLTETCARGWREEARKLREVAERGLVKMEPVDARMLAHDLEQAATLLESRLTPAREDARLREALEPFAKAASIRLCGGDYWTDDKPIQGTDVAFHIRFGDLRRAALAVKAS